MKLQANVLLAAAMVFVLMASVGTAEVVYQTGFEPGEGWAAGYLTTAPNPGSGSWVSEVSGELVQPVIETAAPYTYSAYNLTPATGTGQMYVDRYSAGDQTGNALLLVSDDTAKAWNFEVDMIVANTSAGRTGAITINNRSDSSAYYSSWLAGIMLYTGSTGYVFAYRTPYTWDGSQWNAGTWVYDSTVIPFVEGEGQWVNVRIALDIEDQTYSVYYSYGGGEEATLVEDIGFTQNPTYGATTPQSVGYRLGTSSSLTAYDNVYIETVPEPATVSLLVSGMAFVAFRRYKNKG